VGLKPGLLAALCLLGVCVAGPGEAQAQRTNFQGIAECARAANVQFRRQDHEFRRFVIDRASVSEDRYARMVGNQYISTIYSGSATYDTGGNSRKVMFVCLHGGSVRGALFVYTLPR
jgi:hypothetical protein